MKTRNATVFYFFLITVGYATASPSFAQTEFRMLFEAPVTSKPLDEGSENERLVRSLAYSPDSQRLAIGVKANPLLILDTATGKTWKSIEIPDGVNNFDTVAAYSPDGKTLAISWGGLIPENSKDAIYLYNAESLALEKKVEAFDRSPTQLSFAGNERLLIKFENDKANDPTFRPNYVLLNLKDGSSNIVAKTEDGEWPTAVASLDGKTLAIGISKSLKLLDPATLQEIGKQRFNSEIKGLLYSADSKTLILDLFSELLSFDMITKMPASIAKKSGDDRGSWSSAFGPSELSLIATINEKLYALDLKSLKRTANPKVSGQFQTAVSPDGRQVIILKAGAKIEAWETPGAAAVVKPKPSTMKPMPEPKPAAIPPAAARRWNSADGKFSLEAVLVEVQGDDVLLKRRDTGATIKVPKAKLSAEDRDYLGKQGISK